MTARSSALAAIAALTLLACGDPKPPPKPPARPVGPPPTACPAQAPVSDQSPEKAEAHLGKNVAKVCILGVSNDARAEVASALVTKEGEKLDAVKLHADLIAIMKLRTIDKAAIHGVPAPNGLVVVYALEERARIGEVVFEGAHQFEQLPRKVALQQQRPLVMSEAHGLAVFMKDEYLARGYGSAQVTPKIEPMSPGLVRVRFVVVEGPLWKIGKLTFDGAAKIQEADLAKAAELTEGAQFDLAKIEGAAVKLNALYYDRGMVEVRVDESVGEGGHDGAVPVSFKIQEGAVFRIGKLTLAWPQAPGKAAPADEKAILPILKSKAKDVFSRAALVADMQRVKDFYVKRGKTAEVTPETHLDKAKKTIDVSLVVKVDGP